MRLILPTLFVLARAALADGGAVQLRQEAGDLVITVFASPTPLTAGPADISLLLQKRDGLEPILDANVSLLLVCAASNLELHLHPTREQARNKLLYAAPVMLSKPGHWGISVTVARKGKAVIAAGTLEVAPPPEKALSYAGYIAFPPVIIGLFVVRERLLRRRSRRVA